MNRSRLLAALTLLGILYLLRGPILGLAPRLLTIHDSADAADEVLIFLGDRRFDVAAELYRQGSVERILLFEMRPNWLEARGIVSTQGQHQRATLEERGVLAENIEMVPGEAINSWHAAQNLALFLRAHPDRTLLCLIPELRSREIRHIFRHSLGSDMKRIRFRTLEAQAFETSSWWRSKYGVLAIFTGYTSLLYAWLAGPEPAVWHTWDPEVWLRQRAAEGLELDATPRLPGPAEPVAVTP